MKFRALQWDYYAEAVLVEEELLERQRQQARATNNESKNSSDDDSNNNDNGDDTDNDEKSAVVARQNTEDKDEHKEEDDEMPSSSQPSRSLPLETTKAHVTTDDPFESNHEPRPSDTPGDMEGVHTSLAPPQDPRLHNSTASNQDTRQTPPSVGDGTSTKDTHAVTPRVSKPPPATTDNRPSTQYPLMDSAMHAALSLFHSKQNGTSTMPADGDDEEEQKDQVDYFSSPRISQRSPASELPTSQSHDQSPPNQETASFHPWQQDFSVDMGSLGPFATSPAKLGTEHSTANATPDGKERDNPQASSGDHFLNEDIQIELNGTQPNSPLPLCDSSAETTNDEISRGIGREEIQDHNDDEDIASKHSQEHLEPERQLSVLEQSLSPKGVSEPTEDVQEKHLHEPTSQIPRVCFDDQPEEPDNEILPDALRKLKKRKSKSKKRKNKKRYREESNDGKDSKIPKQTVDHQNEDEQSTRFDREAASKTSQALKERILGTKKKNNLQELAKIWEQRHKHAQRARTTVPRASGNKQLVPGRVVEASKSKPFPSRSRLQQHPSDQSIDRTFSRERQEKTPTITGNSTRTHGEPLHTRNEPPFAEARQNHKAQMYGIPGWQTDSRQLGGPPQILPGSSFSRSSNPVGPPDFYPQSEQNSLHFPRSIQNSFASEVRQTGVMETMRPDEAAYMPPPNSRFPQMYPTEGPKARDWFARQSRTTLGRDEHEDASIFSVPHHQYHSGFHDIPGPFGEAPQARVQPFDYDNVHTRNDNVDFDTYEHPLDQPNDAPVSPPLAVYCSEGFIESWPLVAAELSSGEGLERQGKGMASRRRIDLIDTPSLDQRKIDIELGSKSAILVYDRSRVMNASSCKEFTMKVAKLAAVGCYQDLILILVVRDASETKEAALVDLQLYTSTLQYNSTPPASVHIRTTLVSHLSETIADIVLASEPAATSRHSLTTRHMHNLEAQRAQFLLDAIPMFTLRGSLKCLDVADEMRGQQGVGFANLIRSARTRQNVSLRVTSNQSKALDVAVPPLIQLAEIARVDTRKQGT